MIVLAVLFTRASALETVAKLMAMYLHFGRQTGSVSGLMAKTIEILQAGAARDANLPVQKGEISSQDNSYPMGRSVVHKGDHRSVSC